MITYKNSLEISDSDFERYCQWAHPKTKNHTHLVERTPEELLRSKFAVFAFQEKDIIGCGFVDQNPNWTKWRGMGLAELRTLYVLPKYRDIEIIHKIINLRLDFVEEQKNLFPVTLTKHPNLPKIMQGIAVRVEDVNGQFSEIKSIIRECDCKKKEPPFCEKCPLKARIFWVYSRFIFKQY